ncbi:nucleoside diphosphate kinase 3 isoform X3 [Mirounga leonina]|uniref:nucleoside diphosphate kinase 3 isoform X3 n=1 Tax=Mirounga leonina TaxID=9715 RepID=UPI00156C5792|nr:nucleoside diphosphate kinase 3 isoform X3 [Mirounga leonina]
MKTPLGCNWDSPPGSVEPGPAFALGELAARGKRGAAGLAARSPNASAGRFPPTCGPCQTQPGTVCARIKAEPVPWVVVFLFGVGQPQQVVGRAGEEKSTVWGARPRGARGMGIPGQLPPGPFKRRPLPAAAAIAIMLCLLLTVLAHLFPAACGGVHERTFVAVKPDGVQRRLVGEIVRRFERKGFKLVALKLVQASDELLREHYAELREGPFYGRLVDYMGSGPVVAMVWQGLDVVRASRALMGATDPADAAPGTIRGDFCVEVGKNVIHGSDSVESARREIALWFRSEELLRWEDSAGHWLYE